MLCLQTTYVNNHRKARSYNTQKRSIQSSKCATSECAIVILMVLIAESSMLSLTVAGW